MTSNTMEKIKDELAVLLKFVDSTRKGIDSLESTVKVSSEKVPEASTQLFSVTGDLEAAANTIMTILEGLMTQQERSDALLNEMKQWVASVDVASKDRGMAVLDELEKIHGKSKSDVMDIFANMSFQDLTGQKLKKVIGGLALVESKLMDMALNFGFVDGKKIGVDVTDSKSEKPLKQDIVDKMLKELGM